MSLERVVGVTVAFLLLSSVTVKKTSDIQVRQDADKTAIVQLADVVSDAFAADVALADDNPNYGEREFTDAKDLWKQEDYPKAIDLMEKVVDANPLNQKFASKLIEFYKESGGATDAAEFFREFIDDFNKNSLAQKPVMNKLYAKGIYDIAVQAMYTTIPGICKNQQRNPSFDLYEPVVELLEKAIELQPSKIPKGEELFWANAHYELGWGYRNLTSPNHPEEIEDWKEKGLNEQLNSINIGGKKFVISKRERGFIMGPPYDLSIKACEMALSYDNNSSWKEKIKREKINKQVDESYK